MFNVKLDRGVSPLLNQDDARLPLLGRLAAQMIERGDRGYTQSAHSVSPTDCADYLAEMWRDALERGGVPKRRDVDDRRDVRKKVNQSLCF